MKDMTPDEALNELVKEAQEMGLYEPSNEAYAYSDNTIPLSDGENPPAERLKQPWDIPCTIPSRNCTECGKMHNMCMTDTVKETHTPIDKCYDCFWKNAFIYTAPKERIDLK